MIEQRSTGSIRAFFYACVMHGLLAVLLVPDFFDKKQKALPEGERIKVAFVYSADSTPGKTDDTKRAAPRLIQKPDSIKNPKPKPVKEAPKPVEIPKPKPVKEAPKPVEIPKPKPVKEAPKPVEIPKPKPVKEAPKPVETPELTEKIPTQPAPPLLRKPDVQQEPVKKKQSTPPKKTPAKKDTSFDDIAKALDTPNTRKQQRKSSSDFDDLGSMLEGLDSSSSLSPVAAGAVRDIIKSRIIPHWNIPFTVSNSDMVVTVSIRLQRDGSLAGRPSVKPSRYDGNSVYERLKISTLQAIERSAPFTGLPAQNYSGSNGWNDVILSFTPKDARR